MRKTGGFVGRLGGQMTLTLEDKCEVKVNYALAEIEFDLLMMKVTSAVFTPCCTQPSSKVKLLTQNMADNEQIMSSINLLEKIFWGSVNKI